MYSLHFREELPDAVARELDAMLAAIKGHLSVALSTDGTLLPTAVTTVLVSEGNAEPQQWVAGPWLIGVPGQNTVTPSHVSVDLATGTYNDFRPGGFDTAVVLEIEPQGGAVTLTGLYALNAGAERRLLLIRNRDTTSSITLKHENASSEEQNRFSLPGAADHVIGTDRSYWLYYDRTRARWTVVM